MRPARSGPRFSTWMSPQYHRWAAKKEGRIPRVFIRESCSGRTSWAWIITGRMAATGRPARSWAAWQQRISCSAAASPLQWARSCTPSSKARRTKAVTVSSSWRG